uniref:Glucagon-like peptide 2 receptor n=1 Tax=Sander lucioperca TaxID=283035 RepID=A0A8C9YDV2_SANLU
MAANTSITNLLPVLSDPLPQEHSLAQVFGTTFGRASANVAHYYLPKMHAAIDQTCEPLVKCSNVNFLDCYDLCKNLNCSCFTEIYCKGTFDMFVCWPHSSPGNVTVPCPSYLPWINTSRRAHQECLENGSWRQRENSSEPWRDDSECKEDHYFKDKVGDEMLRQTALRLISVIGYSLSLSSLALATLLMGMLRKLHCTRNYIHMNLFVSFILRAMAIIAKEIILYIMYSKLPKDDSGWNSYSTLMCKFSKVCMEYFVACNYFWLLVEAIFLHTLLFTAVLTKGCLLKKYMLLGWGTPILFVTPWTVVKILYENTECWSIVNKWLWWIIRGPITLSVLIIFFIFIKILMLLLSKLKADQVKFTDYRYRYLARATLVLIPLLGIHEVVFTVLIDECVEGNSRYARNFINLTLSSFQGFLVAVLYCFANGEVHVFCLYSELYVVCDLNHINLLTRHIMSRLHPSIFVCLSGVGSGGQQLQQGNPNFPFPSHINQFRLGDPEAFPGQVGDIIPPPSPGSSPRPLPSWMCLEHFPREAPRGHPYQMPEPPQLASFDAKEQRLYS